MGNTIELTCGHCGKRVIIPDGEAGVVYTCPHCGTKNRAARQTEKKLTSSSWFWVSVVLGILVAGFLGKKWLDGQYQKGYDETRAKYMRMLEAPDPVVTACRSAMSDREAINRIWLNVKEAYDKGVPPQEVMDSLAPRCVEKGYSAADCSRCLVTMINEAYGTNLEVRQITVRGPGGEPHDVSNTRQLPSWQFSATVCLDDRHLHAH